MSERQATLHDERIDLLSAMVVDLRARLATAEAERDVLKNALVDWITADNTDVFNAADERLSKLARRFAAAKK